MAHSPNQAPVPDGSIFAEEIVVLTEHPVIDFGVWPFADGYVRLAGETIYEIAQETFHCYFAHVRDGAEGLLRADELCARLDGRTTAAPDRDVLASIAALFPAGTYWVASFVLEVREERTCYVRIACPADYVGSPAYAPASPAGVRVVADLDSEPLGYGNAVHTGMLVTPPRESQSYLGRWTDAEIVLLPLQRTDGLDPARVRFYEEQLQRGRTPTAVALGFAVNGRALVNVVIDGHHKLFAAARSEQSCRLVTFVTDRVKHEFEAMGKVQLPQPDRIREALRRTERTWASSLAIDE